MNAQELQLRQAHGIPDAATSVLILEQSAHCDWDWVATFDQYYSLGANGHQAVQKTLGQALTYIGDGIANDLPYTYVFCEVAYLQQFWNDAGSQAQSDWKTYAQKGLFLFSSGGITSAENLTLHTEAFIRNYLLGRQWLMETLEATASNQMWIPDDFGHDAQLPALLRAMGFTGAGFERIPSQFGAPQNGCASGEATSDSPTTYLTSDVGYDFLWQARDGSTIQGHWLGNLYCEGNKVFGASPTTAGITTLISQNTTKVMPTAYMFAPIDCDFATPYSDLPSVVHQWNTQSPAPSTWVVMASFDSFMQLVGAASANGDGSSSLQTLYPWSGNPGGLPPFIPHPYYSGCYGSKPFLKTTHYQAVRTLLLAEAMEVIVESLAQSDPDSWETIAEEMRGLMSAAWNALAPSTHHDYITGTAPNGATTCLNSSEDVYDEEQVPRLAEALLAAQDAQIIVTSVLLNAIGTSNDTDVTVFNGLGFTRMSIADLTQVPSGGPFRSANNYPVQDDGNGGLLIQAEVGPLGYTTVPLSTSGPTRFNVLKASIEGDVVTMTNGSLSVQIGTGGILSMASSGGGTNILGGTGNELRFYQDGGNIYRFGNELPCSDAQFQWDSSMTFADGVTITLTESGPLRATAVVSGSIGGTAFTVQYQLYATDSVVRISVTGGAPSGYSVMARFPFTSGAASLTYGTTAHWDNQAPRSYFQWTEPSDVEFITFEPTHEYAAAIDGDGNVLGAVYHYASPAWGIDSGGALLGVLFRNTPGNQNGACGSDPGSYTVSYALALPGAPSMLMAALDVNNPLVARSLPQGDAPLAASMSIASTSDPSALITVAKAGTVNPSQLILRMYQPTNGAMSGVTVTLDPAVAAGYQSGGVLAASAVNALEQPSSDNLNISSDATTVTLDLPYAITTLALGSG